MSAIPLLFVPALKVVPNDVSRASRLRVFLRALAYVRHALRCVISQGHSKMLATTLSVENSSVMSNSANYAEQDHRAEHKANDYRSSIASQRVPNSAEQISKVFAQEKQYQERANEQCSDHVIYSLATMLKPLLA